LNVTIIRILTFFLALILLIIIGVELANAKPPKVRSKFYDFSEHFINGEIRKPTVLYHNTRERVKFERLLSLKKSFLREMFETHRNPVFK